MLNIISTRNLFVKAIICTISVLLKTYNLQNHLNQSIQIAKQNHVNKIAQRLGDPNASSKCYWSLLKTLLYGKKIPCIPPLFHDDKYIVDFQEKVSFFFTDLFFSLFYSRNSQVSDLETLALINCSPSIMKF